MILNSGTDKHRCERQQFLKSKLLVILIFHFQDKITKEKYHAIGTTVRWL